MKLLLVSEANPWVRSIATLHHWVAADRALGHEVALYGEPDPDLPALRYTTDLAGVDLALLVLQVPTDLPDMPLLARLLDGVPRERRFVLDLWGRYNDTIRLEHDFNHLEKLDGHLGWEWEDAIRALAGRILQPTLAPLRPEVEPFLFHGFDPGSVRGGHADARAAAAAWREPRRFGMVYVGSNWQRWEQVRAFLERYPADLAGPACLVGWHWDWRPDWAAEKGIQGVDTDPGFLAGRGVEIRDGVRFDDIPDLLGQARFAPVFHRPLFRHLGFVTNRSFETFHADALPVLMLPRDFVAAIYGPAALRLVPDGDLAAHLKDALDHPEPYWEAVFATRAHLARHHSYAERLRQLLALAGRAQGAAG